MKVVYIKHLNLYILTMAKIATSFVNYYKLTPYPSLVVMPKSWLVNFQIIKQKNKHEKPEIRQKDASNSWDLVKNKRMPLFLSKHLGGMS